MASTGQQFPREFAVHRHLKQLTPGVGPTREAYIHRIAVALIITGGRDPQHRWRTFQLADSKEAKEWRTPCLCRICRAWICVRQTPADELAEAKANAERLKATAEYIDDRIFG
jgi:hypothetical protein